MAKNRPYSRALFHTTALFAALCLQAPNALADPTGGTVTSGSAGISTSGSTTTIHQSTDRAVIRWDTFDVHASEHVNFVQPGADSITVNRIRDTKASQIDGKISANGNIVLINPNGILFGSSSVVDVGSLVATSSDLEDDNAFMNGGAVKFTKPGNADAKIINNGNMTVREGGLIGLVAPNVENNGVIQARLGKVQLASGDIHTIDFAGDGLIKLEISENVYTQSVRNTGTITADGGEILMTAAAARTIVDTLVVNTGTLRAETVTLPDKTQKQGKITLSTEGLANQVSAVTRLPESGVIDAGHNETTLSQGGLNLHIPVLVDPVLTTEVALPPPPRIENTGSIIADGNLVDQVAGSITLLSNRILIGDGSVISASGDSGGGNVRIGGDYQGGGGIPTSDMIFISEHAIIAANARRRGDGGRIILWSDENTRFYGHAEAMGGTENGNGGFIEISGKKFLDFDGTVNLLSARGITGTLLLDPTDIVISNNPNTAVTGSSPFSPDADDATSNLSIATLQAALASGNVVVQTRAGGAQPGTITLAHALSWTSGNTLTLDAHNAITINAAIAAGSGSLTMIAGADVSLNANITGTGTITIRQASDSITMGLAGGAGTLNLSTADLNRIVDGWGNIVLGRSTSNVLLTASARIWADNVTLLSGTGGIAIAGTQAMGANTLTITTANGAVSIAGMTGTSGALIVNSGGAAISTSGLVNTAGAVSLTSGGGTISNSAALTSGALTLTSAGGNITIGANMTAGGIANINAGAGTININAALNAGTNTLGLTTTGSNITSNASGAITSGALTVSTGGGNIQTSANITASGTASFNSGTGLLTLGNALNAGSNTVNLTTTARNITTAALTSGALTINSNGANISTGTISASGAINLTSGNGTISVGNITAGTQIVNLTTTGFAITTNAITSGALTINSADGIITTNGTVAAAGITNINSGAAAMNINAALGSGAFGMTLTTTGTNITKANAGAISASTLTINTSGGNLSVGSGGITTTGAISINTGAGTVGITGALSSGAAIAGITTTGAAINLGAVTSGALTLASGGATIATGALTATGAINITSGAGTINVGAISAGANTVALNSTGFGITAAAITSGALNVASAGGIITLNGAVAAAGITTINSGAAAMNINNQIYSTGFAMNLLTNGGTITKGNTGEIRSAALTITTVNGNLVIGTGGLTTTSAAIITTGTGSAAIGGTWAAGANTISITTTGNTISKGNTTSGALTMNSGGGNITFAGTTAASGIVSANSGAGNIAVNGQITATTTAINLLAAGIGTVTKNALIQTTTGAITITTGGGAINLGTGLLQSTTSGNITVNSNGGSITVGGAGIQTATGIVTLNSGAAGVITVNSVINLTGTTGNLNITTDTDIVLNVANALTGGGGTLTIAQFTASKGIGIGAGQAGDILISAAEKAMIRDGWGNIVFGRADGTGAINIAANSWTDSVTLRSSSGVISLNGAQTFGTANNFTITTDADIVVAGAITGTTGTLIISPQTNATGIGLGTGEAGAISFTDTERGFLTNTWASVIIGSTAMTGDINMNAGTWNDPMSFRTNTGVINVNGAQTMAAGNNLVFLTNADLNLGANISGSGAGTLTISTVGGSATTMGIGDGMAGTLNLTDAELARIQFGWTSITLGSTTTNGAINVGAWTWDDALNILSGTGSINVGNTSMTLNNTLNVTSSNSGAITTGTLTTVTGGITLSSGGGVNAGAITTGGGSAAITVAGANAVNLSSVSLGTNGNLTITANGDVNFTDNISTAGGTSVLTIQGQAAATTMGIGNGEAGTVNLTDAELDYIQNGWNNIILGNAGATGLMNLGNYAWQDNLTLRSAGGVISVGGATMGANNLTIITNGNLALNGAVSGSGTLTIRATSNTALMALGNAQTGDIQITATELAHIQNDWTSVVFGHTGLTTGVINVGDMVWGNNITFTSGTAAININGTQEMGSNNLTFTTNGDPNINAGLSGTGNLLFQVAAAATTMGIGTGQAGALQLSNTDLGNVLNGWNTITFGSTTQTGAMTIGAYTWQYDTIFRTGTGVITIAGNQNTTRDLTYETNGNMAINAAMNGSGTLTIRQATIAGTLGIAGATATNNMIDATELGRITDGWDQIVFGRADTNTSGIMTVNAYTWNDNVKFVTGSGVMTIAGDQNAQGNNMTLSANSNIALNAALIGTGDLTIEGSVASTRIFLVNAGATADLALTATELNRIADGWNSLTFGSNTSTGNISIGAYTWKDNATFITNGNIAVTGAQGSNANTDVAYVTLAGRFSVSAGATPFSGIGTGGRYLIYSVQASDDTYSGGFVAPTAIFSQSYYGMPPSMIAAGENRIIYSNGAAKILYLKIDDKTKIYGDTLPTFTYTYLGGLQGADTLGTALTSVTLSAAGASLTDNVGTLTTITGIFATALGYTTHVVDGTLSVTKAPILVTTSNDSKTYGDATPAPVINYIGLRNGETSAMIDMLATASSGTDEFSNAGTYAILVSGAFDNNYTFNYAPGTLTINKAVLTATTQDATREYRENDPSFNVVYTGFRNGDDGTDITTGVNLTTTALFGSNVGTYSINATGGLSDNYTFAYANTGLLTVTKATLTATTTNATRQYGLVNPALAGNIVYTGFKGTDTTSAVTTAATVTTNALITDDVGNYTISAIGANATNYDFVYVNTGVLSVTKAMLTATTQNATREYGLANPAMTFSYSGFRNGNTALDLDTGPMATSTADLLSNVGTYGITGSGGIDNNYDFTYVNTGVLSVTKATLTVTTNNAIREYGVANPAFTVSYSGFRNGDDDGDILTGPAITNTSTLVTGIGTSAITASGANDENYQFTYVNSGLLTITRAVIDVTLNNATREYGLSNPALSVAGYTGFRNGEDSSVFTSLATAITAADITSDVGSYAIGGTGAAAANYSFNYIGGTLSVTKAMLTATTQNATREYGLTNPAMTVTYTGFRNGDDETDLNTLATATTAATIFSAVGTYDITSSGAFDNNYDFTYADTGDLSITQATLTATTQNATRQYGAADPAFAVVYTGFRNGDDETDIDTQASISSTATVTSDVGTYDINATGAADNNYTFIYVNSGDLSVTKATLLATTQDNSREYGTANTGLLNVVYTGFLNGDDETDIDTLATAGTIADLLSGVGTYAITASGGFDNNYTITYANTGNLSVTKAMLTVTTQNATREYGIANTGLLNVAYTGFRNGDDETDVNTLAAAATVATIGSGVGTYDITSSGAFDDNYDFTYVDSGDLTITQATLLATTQNATREYGLANPAFDIVYTGFRNGDDETDIDTQATAISTAGLLSNVGTYAITASGGVDANYAITYANTGQLSVTKAVLTATTQDATREYGLANPVFTVTYTGFRNGDDETDIDTGVSPGSVAGLLSNVGTYAIIASGGLDNNYSFTYTNTGQLSVTKAMLTATTQNATRQYGLANPAFDIVYTGFRNGEDHTDIDTLASGASVANQLSNVGTYGITGSGGVDNNYDFTYADTGILNVTKAPVVVSVDNKYREIGEPDPAFTATYSGLRNGDTSAVFDTLPAFSTTATALSPLGDYTISATGADDNNYSFTYSNGVLSIVLDSSIPPTGPPTGVPPLTSLPSTVEWSINHQPSYNFATLFGYTDIRTPEYMENADIIFIDDDLIFSGGYEGKYLIAISESLKREFYLVDAQRRN